MSDLFSLLMGPLLRLWNWATYELRVSRAIVRKAAEQGLLLQTRAVRHHLYEFKFVRRINERESRNELRESLSVFSEGSDVSIDQIFEWFEAAVTERASSVVATTAVGAGVRESIESLKDSVETADLDQALWDERLARYRPLRALFARSLYSRWPRIVSVVRLLDGDDRADVLESWSKVQPQFLAEAPADVFCWLADLATDGGALSAARTFLEGAIAKGASPLGYWEVRLRQLRRQVGGSDYPDPLDAEHNLTRAWLLERDGNIDAAQFAIESWVPKTPDEAATRDLLRSNIAISKHDFGTALDLALPLWKRYGSPAGALIAARAMVARQMLGSSDLYASGTADAFALLVSARDLLREWRVDTTDIVVFAATVARLLNDPARALSLTTAAPAGEATPSEAGSLKVRAAAALMRAENDDVHDAKALLAEPGLSLKTSSQLKALIAVSEGDLEAAVRYYEEAIALTDDYEEKGRFTLSLARLGVVHPFAEEQRELGSSVFAEHMRLIADAYGGVEGGIDRLQAAAHTSPTLSLLLSDLYEARDEPAKQIRVLEAAAERLDDADIWLAAARLQATQGEVDAAIRGAQRALAAAPQSWGAFARTYILLVELLASNGDWDRALKFAENLVRILPRDQSAIWTLITCQYFAGEFDDALRTWDTMASRERPIYRQHLLVWLGLFEQFGESIGTMNDLVNVANDWAGDEEVRRLIVGLLIPPRRTNGGAGVASDDKADLNQMAPAAAAHDRDTRAALFDGYFRDFPDGAFQRLTVNLDDEGSILDRIAEAVGEPPDTSDFDEQVFTGLFPLGMISRTHGGTLAEAVVSHASGVRYCTRNDHEEDARARQAAGQGVVADTTALFLLATLPEDLRSALMGVFAALSVSSEQFRDAVAGLRSTERFGFASPALGQFRGSVARRTRLEDERSLDATRLADLVELMRPMSREARTLLRDDDGNALFSGDVWFAGAGVAGTTRLLWSDDGALNRLAGELGVRAFSTPALVNALENEGRLSSDVAYAIRTHLIAERYLTVPFDTRLYSDAMNLRGGAAMNVASVIEHLDGTDAEDKLSFMLDNAASQTPDDLRLERWISAVTRWISRISPDAVTNRSNLAILTNRLARANWMVTQTFPSVDAGILDGLDGADGVDPLADEVERLFRQIAATDRSRATNWVFNLIAGVGQRDRLRYTAIVLRP